MTNISPETIQEIHTAIFETFQLTEDKKTGKGWYEAECPFCGKEDHLGIRMMDVKPFISYNCFKCQESGNLFNLAKQIDSMDIWRLTVPKMDATEDVKAVDLSSTSKVVESGSDEPIYTIKLPRGFKEVSESEYLDGRGFLPWQYSMYGVGESVSRRFQNYIIFPVKFRGEVVGYLGRCTLDDEEIDQINEDAKNLGSRPMPKYRNSEDSFGRILGGFDEVSEFTRWIVLVEGFMDKASVDRYIREKYRDGSVVCMCTFGKKISPDQLKLLEGIDTINKISIMYDPDAMNDVKSISAALENRSDGYTVRVVPMHDKDPGEMTTQQIAQAINKEQSPTQFQYGNVQAPKLRR